MLPLTAAGWDLSQTLRQTARGIAVGTEDQCKSVAPKIRIEQHTLTGGLWFAAWLFTIGYLHLSFWMGVFALVVWPYFIGVHVSALMR